MKTEADLEVRESNNKNNNGSWRQTAKIIITLLCVMLASCLLCSCGKNTRKEKELREQAIGFMEQGNYSAAVARFDEALSYKDGKYGSLELDILRYKAEAQVLAGDYASAADTYAELRKLDGDKPEYMNLEVICKVRAGESLTKCLQLYEHSCEVDPTGTGNSQALYVLGSALSKSGDEQFVNKAIELYERALNTEGAQTGELYNRIGSMIFEQGDYDTAIDWFQKGIEFVQNHPEMGEEDVLASLKYNIAICYEYKQEYETAKNLFQEYAQQYGSNEVIEHEIDFLESRIR